MCVFPLPPLQVPLYVVRGNHDYHQNPRAEIDYYVEGIDDRWYFPSPYYSVSKTFCSSVTDEDTAAELPQDDDGDMTTTCNDTRTADFIFLDAPMLAPNHTRALDVWDPNFPALLPDNVEEERRIQLAWLNETLATSIADWLIVLCHYPIFSIGEHGDVEELYQDLLPILERYEIDAIISGHDHTLQRLQRHHIQHFISGAGSLIGDLNTKSKAKSMAAELDYGFMQHQFDDHDGLHTKAVNNKGKVLFEYTQKVREVMYV